jgi:nicotinate-nucleotide pyrophosphorylase (carboxylating)
MSDDFQQQLQALIGQALREDVGSGDHSSLCCIDPKALGKARLNVKDTGILAGVGVAEQVFRFLEPDVVFQALMRDGDPMRPGDIAFEVDASVQVILKAERLALNCMQRMSGIATLTRRYVEKLQGSSTRLLDTRKTTPNFRLLEKAAVKIGGGTNHRFGLYDMIMLKDNHIDYCGGIARALDMAYDYVHRNGYDLKIEVETRNLNDVEQVLRSGKADIIMLDNFSPELVADAVRLIAGRMQTEASGGITLDNIAAYAATGVDFVSSGAIIHQAVSLDLSLKAVLQP